MKKIVLLLAALFVFASCSVDNQDHPDFHVAFLPADSVSTPAYVVPGQSYPITMYYKRPDDCHYLDGFYYDKLGNIRTVAIQSIVLEHSDCQPVTDTAPDVATFDFECPIGTYNSYVFKFYKGDDAQGTQQFIEVEVPVQH
jgi:hypothetical protein